MADSTQDTECLVPQQEFQDAKRRVTNLAEWVALGGCVPTESIWD